MSNMSPAIEHLENGKGASKYGHVAGEEHPRVHVVDHELHG